MAGIFISYRREDAAGEAGRLYDRLSAHFGADQVFRDVDAIEPGERFPAEIEERLAGCGVVIALIGKRWSGGLDEEGGHRIDEPDDFVRLEIATALRREVTVIPALLGDAELPRQEELPEDLQSLRDHQAVTLDTETFHDDVTRLIEVLERHARPAGRLRRLARDRRVLGTAGVAALGLVALAVIPFVRDGEEIRLRSAAGAVSTGQARAMMVEHGFYSAASNSGAPGIGPSYSSSVEEGVPVVIDEATGLMWQHRGSGQAVQGGWDGAATHVRDLNRGRHAGFDDWRLPTLEEAMSLLQPETRDGFHLDPAFDAGGAPFVWTADIWTSEDAGDADSRSSYAWLVYYLDGYADREVSDFNAYVRAVRSTR